MPQQHYRNKRVHTLYSADTDPGLPRITQPVPSYYLPGQPEPWHRRLTLAIQEVIAFIVRKIILTINFALALVLLILISRFVLTTFSLHDSIFSAWTFELSDFLLLPFDHLLPTLPYHGLLIDTNILVAILIYTLVTKFFTAFLNSLLGTRKKKARQRYP